MDGISRDLLLLVDHGENELKGIRLVLNALEIDWPAILGSEMSSPSSSLVEAVAKPLSFDVVPGTLHGSNPRKDAADSLVGIDVRTTVMDTLPDHITGTQRHSLV
jgi:hypothetical protein